MTPTEAAETARQYIKAGRRGDAWTLLAPFEQEASASREIAWALLEFLHDDPNPPELGATLRAMLEVWKDPWILYFASVRLLAPIDGRPADEVIAGDDPALAAIGGLERAWALLSDSERQNPEEGGFVLSELGNAYRHGGPRYDCQAEDAYRNALALENRPGWRFNLRLLFKQRGRWAEGSEVFEALVDEGRTGQPELWNLAICATGAGQGERACAVWRQAGFDAQLGSDGLPQVSNLGEVKVRISNGALSEALESRDYEHVWVQPVSPCHGRILNPTMTATDYEIGDVVLWDGQPIGRWRHGEREGPRFGALCRLAEGDISTFWFRGRQVRSGQIGALMRHLPQGCYLYPFTEQVAFECNECLRTGGPHEASHAPGGQVHTVVTGKLVKSPDVSFETLRVALEKAIAAEQGAIVAVPDLYRLLGDEREVQRHERLEQEIANLS